MRIFILILGTLLFAFALEKCSKVYLMCDYDTIYIYISLVLFDENIGRLDKFIY